MSLDVEDSGLVPELGHSLSDTWFRGGVLQDLLSVFFLVPKKKKKKFIFPSALR